ncbi:uncharacterized protein DNG_08586 [Cephalotrichum gorgonifer]|uniref:NACHT domain-containing protein n=1 Tax=Cephalotrichum gorgonifer TaxID=2041049 RepID=A0AAE8SZB2_9PEZI|nr:uncharacterized protein DNG_08586 [Cephalotrichum gorgonifer]
MDSDQVVTAALPGPESRMVASDNIFEAATICRRRFEEYLQVPRLYGKQVTEFQRRFQTWAEFLGVFAPLSACLDTRLAGAPEMKELVMSMLAVLRRNLERGTKRHRLVAQKEIGPDAEATAESDGAIIGITGSIDRLSRLALIIRASSKPEGVERILRSSRKREPDGFDDVIFALVKWRFPPVDPTDESLQVQLASSIIYRRNRLRYQFRHETKLSADRNDETESETVPTEPPVATQKQSDTGQPALAQRLAAKDTLLKQVLTHRVPEGLREGGAKSDDASSSRSNNPFINAEYPQAPAVPPGHSDSKLHVDEDLKPYVCISEQCGNLPPAFSTRQDWRNHMQNKHGADWARYIHPSRHHWLCTLQHSTPFTFDSEELLLEHLRGEHPKDLPDSQYALIASRSKVPMPSEAQICRFCGEDVALTSSVGTVEGVKSPGKLVTGRRSVEAQAGELSPTANETPSTAHGPSHDAKATLKSSKKDALAIRMWKHIADHLEYLSLWSLRWWDDDSGASAEESKEGASAETKGGSQFSSHDLEAMSNATSDGSLSVENPSDTEEPLHLFRLPSTLSSKMTSPHEANVTVGWIVPMALELTPAVLMLEDYELFPKHETTYHIGRIGPHWVAVVVCPRIGNSPAATVVTDMHRSFPNIKHVLVVGIAGGIPYYGPDMKQIVLGDVVVSCPWGSEGGVAHYEFGAWEGKTELSTKSHTLHPSDPLLTAVRTLESNHMRKPGSQIPIYLGEMRGGLVEEEQPEFEDPGGEEDRLFLDEYPHPDRTKPCDGVCDISKSKQRSQRGRKAVRWQDTPRVHYGIIGSSNALVISSMKRNELYKKYEVICFEMESGGVMGNHQALVIRGICDYADSHKNKRWQKYAAATAAACAKEILLLVPAAKLDDGPSLTEGNRGDSSIAHGTVTQAPPVTAGVINAFPDMTDRSMDITPAAKGTYSWLLQHQKYKAWISRNQDLLWIKGKPGSGKSTLLKYALKNHSAGKDDLILSFFFYGRGNDLQKSPLGFFRSLLHQILKQVPDSSPDLIDTFDAKCKDLGGPRDKWQWHLEELQSFFESSLLKVLETRSVWLFIDALDESGESAVNLSQWIQFLLRTLPPTHSQFHSVIRVTEQKDDYDRIPLSWAAGEGHEDIVNLFLSIEGVEIDSKDYEGQTPLSWAAINGHAAIVKLLFDTGRAEIDSKDGTGQTPLSWAAVMGHEAIARLICETGKAEIDSKDMLGMTPLSWASRNGHVAIVKLLFDTGRAEIDSKDREGQTPLLWAARMGHEAIIRLLLDIGNVEVTVGVVMAATESRKGLGALSLLLDRRGTDVEVTEAIVNATAGNTSSGVDVMRLLLDRRGAEVKITEAIVNAAAGNTSSGADVMKLLLDRRGAEVKVTEAVIKAAAGNKGSGADVIRLLLDRRATVEVTAKMIQTLWDEFGRDMMELLEKTGVEAKTTGAVVETAQ